MREQRYQTGFTLVEVLVSMTIGLTVLVVTYGFVQISARGYERAVEAVAERATARTAFDLIRRDLERRCRDLPLSIGIGADDAGFTFANGGVVEWDAGHGSHFPAEASLGFPNDRLGFFITIPERKAVAYEGLRVAHVLYFTAITRDDTPERLLLASDVSGYGYSRKLFRQFTPPDRVYERLKLLNPVGGRGNVALPRGPHFASGVADDDGWGSDAEDAIVSLVAEDVAQFSLRLSVGLLDEIGFQEASSSLLVKYAAPVSVHDLMVMDRPVPPTVSPQRLNCVLRLCPHQVSSTLKVEDWNKRVGETYLGRDGVIPVDFSFVSYF